MKKRLEKIVQKQIELIMPFILLKWLVMSPPAPTPDPLIVCQNYKNLREYLQALREEELKPNVNARQLYLVEALLTNTMFVSRKCECGDCGYKNDSKYKV